MKIDKLALQFFDKPEHFGAAMKLLHAQAKAWDEYGNLPDVEEHFYTHVHDHPIDDWLFTKGGRFADHVNGEVTRLQSENEFLREALLNSKSTSAIADQEQLIDKILESIHPKIPESENPTLTALFDRWVAESTMREVSLNDTYKPVIDLFIKYINDLHVDGDARINDLTVANIRLYREFIKKLPKGAKVKGESITSLVELSNKGNGNKKSTKTINGTYANVGTFLKWISKQGYPVDANIHPVLTNNLSVGAKDKSNRVPLSDEDISNLFSSTQYTTSGKFKTSGMYWAPLIALFTGARMGEILQLETHDIQQIDKRWIFDINDDNLKTKDKFKHVKTDGSQRQVPVHRILIKLGFIDYVKKQNGSLFPDEPRNPAGKFDNFQKRFATYRKSVDVAPHHKMERRDFHSFRHTVRTRLSEIGSTGSASQRFGEGIIDAMVGHSSKDRSEGQITYDHSRKIQAKTKALNRLQYECVDFDAIMSWDKCSFYQKQFKR